MKKIIIVITLMLFVTGCAKHLEDGTAYLKEGKYQEAISSFQKQIDKDKDLDEAYRGQGIAYYELGEYEKAISAFQKALENGAEKTSTIHSFLGASYLQLEEYELSLNAYENALATKDITDALKQEAQFNIIAIYEKLGNWEEAKKQMELYVEQYPDDSRVEKEAEFLETR